MKLVTVSQMQAIEKEADAGGLTYDQMMENAGQGLADIILDLYAGDEVEPEVVGLVGPAIMAAIRLWPCPRSPRKAGRRRAYLVKRKKDDLVKRFLEAGGEVLSGENAFEQLAEDNRNRRCPSGWYSWHRHQIAVEEGCCGTFIGSQ